MATDLAPILVAGGLSLGGVLIGLRGQRVAGRDSWVRDRRLDAYEEVQRLAYEVWEDMLKIEAKGEDPAAMHEAMRQLDLAVLRVQMVGPASAANAALHLAEDYDELRRRLVDPSRSAPILDDEIHERMTDSDDRFRVMARRALGTQSRSRLDRRSSRR